MSSGFVVYALFDPRDPAALRYVGQTRNMQERYEAHMKEAQCSSKRCHRLNWLRKLLREGVKPTMIELLTCETRAEAHDLEVMVIDICKCYGDKLTNETVGGWGGMRTLSAHRRWLKSYYMTIATPEYKEKRLAAMRKMHADPEFRAAAAKRLAKVHASPTWRANVAAGARYKRTPEILARQAASQKERMASKEVREQMSEIGKKVWQKHRLKYLEGFQRRSNNPTWRANNAEAIAKVMARPEVRAKMSESQKIARIKYKHKFEAATKKMMANPTWRKNAAEAHKLLATRPEWRAKNLAWMTSERHLKIATAASKEYHNRPEVKAAKSEARSKLWADPVWREKTIAAMREKRGQRDAHGKFTKKYSPADKFNRAWHLAEKQDLGPLDQRVSLANFLRGKTERPTL